MTRFLFDRDPLTGTTEWFIPDESAGTFTIHTEQDVAGLVEQNKAIANEFNGVHAPYGDEIGASTRVASIPTSIYYDLLKKHGHMRVNPGPWKRWLNDPDNAAFRTRPGQV
jgi:hypothetical protein